MVRDMSAVLEELTKVLEARKRVADPSSSYVASLHAGGIDKILKKVGEESAETLLAAKDVQQAGTDSAKQKGALVYETADLWFHTLVMLSHYDLSAQDIVDELARRFDLSGLVEKASRPQ
jgi:phosphoribosyl-ATP pyrophosphohydrolase